uniref:Uncharacterized protein n=1 Tax=Arion vulgaris TaxID=1028688 RepID=A0A0B6Y8Y3_9EUPU
MDQLRKYCLHFVSGKMLIINLKLAEDESVDFFLAVWTRSSTGFTTVKISSTASFLVNYFSLSTASPLVSYPPGQLSSSLLSPHLLFSPWSAICPGQLSPYLLLLPWSTLSSSTLSSSTVSSLVNSLIYCFSPGQSLLVYCFSPDQLYLP